jgi:hypothetical protein
VAGWSIFRLVYQLCLPNSGAIWVLKGAAEAIEVADEIGLDEAQVAADLDAWDDAAP